MLGVTDMKSYDRVCTMVPTPVDNGFNLAANCCDSICRAPYAHVLQVSAKTDLLHHSSQCDLSNSWKRLQFSNGFATRPYYPANTGVGNLNNTGGLIWLGGNVFNVLQGR